MKEIVIAIIGTLGTLLGIALTLAVQRSRARQAARQKAELSLSTAEIEDRAKAYSLLIAAYNQMLAAERSWTQKELEIERARYVAQEQLSRREDEHKRELREERRLNEEQHEEIVRLEAELQRAELEISSLRTRIEAGA